MGCLGRSTTTVLVRRPLIQPSIRILKVGREGLAGHHRNSKQHSELTIWKTISQILFVLHPDAGVGQAAHCSKHTAAVDAIANREGAANHEGIAQSGYIPDVGNEFLASAEIRILRIEGLLTFGGVDAENVAIFEIRH